MAKETAKQKKERLAAEAKAAAEAANTAPSGLLANAVAASNSGQPFMATEASMHALLTDPRGPLVEFNAQFRQGDKIAFRATALGMQVHQAGYTPAAPVAGAWGTPQPNPPTQQPNPPMQQQPAPNAPAASVARPASAPKVEDGIAVPSARRGGRGAGVYGFETLNVSQSFFVPMSADNPNPAKRIASTVSSASERLAPKKFIVRTVVEPAKATQDNPTGKGARVWRTA